MTPAAQEVADTTTETVPVAVDGTADENAGVAAKVVTKAPRTVTKHVVAARDEVSGAVEGAATAANGHRPKVRESVVTVPSTVRERYLPQTQRRPKDGVAEPDKHAGESATTNNSSDQG